MTARGGQLRRVAQGLHAVKRPREALRVVDEEPGRQGSVRAERRINDTSVGAPPPAFENGKLLEDDVAEQARGKAVEEAERSRRRRGTSFHHVVVT